MKINSITTYNTNNITLKNQKHKNKISEPIKNGIQTTSIWFGFGVGLDFLSRKCSFSKSPVKNSLILNGIIGSAAGIVTVIKNMYEKK